MLDWGYTKVRAQFQHLLRQMSFPLGVLSVLLCTWSTFLGTSITEVTMECLSFQLCIDLSPPSICCCCCYYVASVMSDSVRPHRRQPTRLRCPWESLGKNTGVGCHFLLQCMKVKSESEVTQSCSTFATLWTAAYQAPPSMGFSRQE